MLGRSKKSGFLSLIGAAAALSVLCLGADIATAGTHLKGAVGSAPMFAPPAVMHGVLNTQTTISADLNGDALPDLVTGATIYDPARQGIFDVVVTQMNLGSTLYGRPVQTTLDTEHAGNGIDAVAAGDINRDGKADVVVGIMDVFARTRNIGVVLGHGDGRFDRPRWYAPSPSGLPPGPRVHSLALADVNRDGRLDIIVEGAGPTQRQMSVLRGRGDGTFRSPLLSAALPLAGDVMGVLVGDMDGDAIPDLVLPEQLGNTNYSAMIVHIEHGKGDGSFAEASQLSTDTNPARSQLVDVNNDGRLDLVLSGWGGTDGGRGGLFVYRGSGAGTIESPAYYPITAADLVAADFNHDGNVDIATGTQSADGTKIFAEFRDGDGTGAFPMSPTVTLRTKGYMSLGVDVDKDLRIDLVTQVVTAPGERSKIAIYRNTTP